MSDSSKNIEFYVKNIEKFEQSGDKDRVSFDIINSSVIKCECKFDLEHVNNCLV